VQREELKRSWRAPVDDVVTALEASRKPRTLAAVSGPKEMEVSSTMSEGIEGDAV